MRSSLAKKYYSNGTTLVELITAIVIISVALTGLLNAIMTATQLGSDPVILQQASAIADSYLQEIQSKSFPASIPCTANSKARADFTDVCDYAFIGNPSPQVVTNQFGQTVTELSQYGVAVTVTFNTLPQLGNDGARIDVTVTHPLIEPYTLTGYRGQY